MKYRNAAEILPEHLLRELQRHTAGQLLYIPACERQEWGSQTGAKRFYSQRNAEIRGKYFGGQAALPVLCEDYCLSEEAVKTILYQKGEHEMKENDAIDYSGYYWQNELVRVRRSRTDDWKYHNAGYNSQERFFTDCEQELPTSREGWKENWEQYIKSNENNDKWICLAFETLEGEYVGGGNLRFDDERNGVFGYFVGGEKRYAIAALCLMLDYAFNERRMNKCQTYFLEGDAYNIEMVEELGFKKEGVLRGKVFHQGRFWDEHHYGLFAEEFNSPKK